MGCYLDALKRLHCICGCYGGIQRFPHCNSVYLLKLEGVLTEQVGRGTSEAYKRSFSNMALRYFQECLLTWEFTCLAHWSWEKGNLLCFHRVHHTGASGRAHPVGEELLPFQPSRNMGKRALPEGRHNMAESLRVMMGSKSNRSINQQINTISDVKIPFLLTVTQQKQVPSYQDL